MLELEAVRVDRGGVTVVDDVTLSVSAGEVLALLGPSGAGKSSLLLAVAGLVDVAAGTVRLGERDVTGVPPHRRGVGVVFQEYALFPHLDVRANVVYGLHGDGRTGRAHAQVADAWLERVGLEPDVYARRDVAALSGGQRQRVALARALAPGPAVLLLDEPLGSLDRQLRDELLDELADVVRADGGPAVVVVTHDRDEAFTLGDRVAVLREGRLVACDTPDGLWDAPPDVWTARFLGHDNVLDGPAAGALGLTTTAPQLLAADALHLGPVAGGRLVGEVVGDGWRDGRRRLRLATPVGQLVVAVPPGDQHRVGDRVGITSDPGAARSVGAGGPDAAARG